MAVSVLHPLYDGSREEIWHSRLVDKSSEKWGRSIGFQQEGAKMMIYLSALSRVRLAVWLSDKSSIPGFDTQRWGRLLKAQEEILYPIELMMLSSINPTDVLVLEGEVQQETSNAIVFRGNGRF